MAGCLGRGVWAAGSNCTSRRGPRSRPRHARRCCLRLQSRQRIGAMPTSRGCEPHAHPARMLGSRSVPLTLLSQRAGTTGAAASFIDDPQAPICFAALFARKQGLACWARYRPIGLEDKSLPTEAPRLPGSCDHRRAIASRKPLPACSLGHSFRARILAQFGEAEILARKLVMIEALTPTTNAGLAPPASPAWPACDRAHRARAHPSQDLPAVLARS